MIIDFFRQLLSPNPETSSTGYSRINSRKDFNTVIDRETERADRSGLIFSIILFDFTQVQSMQRSIDFMLQLISARMRTSDEAGWLSDEKLGMVLYNTSHESALVLADEIRATFDDTNVEPPAIDIFIYPDDAQKLSVHSTDNRRMDRVNLELDTWLVVNEGDTEKHFKNVKTRNISIKGLFLESETVFKEGTTVDMNLFFPINDAVTIKHDKIIIKASGEVVRSENGGMGIKFDKNLSILPCDID
jgi:hypothetical protein